VFPTLLTNSYMFIYIYNHSYSYIPSPIHCIMM